VKSEPRKKDLRRVVGMFTGSELSKQVDAEISARRAAQRLEELGPDDDEPKPDLTIDEAAE